MTARTPAEIAAEADALRNNLREAWSALAMIREAVETLGPVGAMPAREHQSGPTFMDEAEAIVAGVRRMVPDSFVVVRDKHLELLLSAVRMADRDIAMLDNRDATTETERRADAIRATFWSTISAAAKALSARPQDGGGA